MSIKYKLLMLFFIPLLTFLVTSGLQVSRVTAEKQQAIRVTQQVKAAYAVSQLINAAADELMLAKLMSQSMQWKSKWQDKFSITDKRMKDVTHEFGDQLPRTFIERFEKNHQHIIDGREATKLSPVHGTSKYGKAISGYMWTLSRLATLDAPGTVTQHFGNYLSLLKAKLFLQRQRAGVAVLLSGYSWREDFDIFQLGKLTGSVRSELVNFRQRSAAEWDKPVTAFVNEYGTQVEDHLLDIVDTYEGDEYLITVDEWLALSGKSLKKFAAIETQYLQTLLSITDSIQAEKASSQLQWTITAILMTIITLGLGVFIIFNIYRPLQDLTMRFEDIAQGDGDLTKRLRVIGNDEFANLSNLMNNFLEHLQNTIKQVSQTAQGVTSGAAITEQKSGEIKTIIQTQTDNIGATVDAIRLMNESAQHIANSALSASEVTNESHTMVKSCHDEVNENYRAIELIVKDTEETRKQTQQLENHTTNIQSIITTIESIAEQTNLLALNAAIEAARAGENGRGFAVVADEVRTLAKRTQDSTTEISDMLSQLGHATEGVVTIVRQTENTTIKGMERAQNAANLLEQITSQFENINAMTSEIATATQQQNASCSETSDNMHELQNIASSMLDKANASTDSALELHALADEQQRQMTRFKIA